MDLNIIIPAFLGFLGIVSPLVYKVYALKKQNENLKNEIRDVSMSLKMELEHFNNISSAVQNIMKKTKADRFLILTATNGNVNMRFATAIYEQNKNNPKVHLSLGAVSKYVNFEFDSHYRDMLKEVQITGELNLDVSKMPDSDLRNIYEEEEINFSNLYFLSKTPIDGEGNMRMFYCSVATHKKTPFTARENTGIRVEVSKIKSYFKESEVLK